MSARHVKLVKWLHPCSDAQAWLGQLPDAMGWDEVWKRCPEEWQWWLQQRVRETGSSGAPKGWAEALRDASEAFPDRRTAPTLAFFAALRCETIAEGLAEMAHPADAWTLPALLGVEVGAGALQKGTSPAPAPTSTPTEAAGG